MQAQFESFQDVHPVAEDSILENSTNVISKH